MRAPAAGGNEVEESVMRLPFHPRGPAGLDPDQRLSLADRIPLLYQPFDDLRGPRRGHRALAAPRDDRAEDTVRGDETLIPPGSPGHGGAVRPPRPSYGRRAERP